ncbi:MAG: 4Fe-4S binding protein [Selenomonadaceae bacterium]|nr:4Fe-4S binding protein [Selenomonadaceae bacterium]
MNRREFLKQAALISAGVLFCRKSAAALPNYFITDACVGCETCYKECPKQAISNATVPLKINQDLCIHCGNCYAVCPHAAVVKR